MSTAAHSRSETAAHAGFISDRLGAALAVLPLGVWTLVHLWNNLAAFEGGPAWEAAVTEYPHPMAQGITWAVVFIPLIWHTVWGLARIGKTRPNYPRYGYFANFKYILQRLSALGLLAFLGAHLWLAFIKPRFVEGRPEPFADIAHEMHFHRPTTVVYILGVLAVAYHFGNGLHQALMTWGVSIGKDSLRRWQLLAWVVFVGMLVMGWAAIYRLFQLGAQT